jgi:hypothetical protein
LNYSASEILGFLQVEVFGTQVLRLKEQLLQMLKETGPLLKSLRATSLRAAPPKPSKAAVRRNNFTSFRLVSLFS